MRSTDFIHHHALQHLKRKGFTERQAVLAADHVLKKYLRNEIQATKFVQVAEQFAVSSFGRPKI